MTTIQIVKKEVKQLRRSLLPKKDITIMFAFGPTDVPHGRYGHRIIHIGTNEIEAVREDEEVLMLKQGWESLPKHCYKPDHMWSTFEKYLKSRECSCKLHKKVKS